MPLKMSCWIFALRLTGTKATMTISRPSSSQRGACAQNLPDLLAHLSPWVFSSCRAFAEHRPGGNTGPRMEKRQSQGRRLRDCVRAEVRRTDSPGAGHLRSRQAGLRCTRLRPSMGLGHPVDAQSVSDTTARRWIDRNTQPGFTVLERLHQVPLRMKSDTRGAGHEGGETFGLQSVVDSPAEEARPIPVAALAGGETPAGRIHRHPPIRGNRYFGPIVKKGPGRVKQDATGHSGRQPLGAAETRKQR